MIKGKTLYEIREAELGAKKTLEQAELDKQEIIANARQKSIELVSDKEIEIEKSSKARMETAEQEIENEKKELATTNKAEVKKLDKHSSANVDKAVDYVITKFKKEAEQC